MKTFTKKKYAVGDLVWFVPNDSRRGRDPQFVKVVKVGRKWLELECYGYADIETGRVVNEAKDYTLGCIWDSDTDYNDWQDSQKAWTWLIRKMGYHPPKSLKAATIHEAARLFGFDPKTIDE